MQQEPAFLQELPACAAAPLTAAEGDPAGQPDQPNQPDQANQPEQPPTNTNTDTNTQPETDAEQTDADGFIKAPINPEGTEFYWWKVENAVLQLKLGAGQLPAAGPWPWADQAQEIETIVLPDTVNSVSPELLQSCPHLKRLELQSPHFDPWNSLIRIPTDGSHGIIKLDLPELEEIVIAPGGNYYTNQGILYAKDGGMLFAPQCVKGDIVLPDCTDSSASYDFSGCKNITSVTFPKQTSQENICQGGFHLKDEIPPIKRGLISIDSPLLNHWPLFNRK